MSFDLEYEVEPPTNRLRTSRDWWAITRAAIAMLWALSFLVFTSSNYTELNSWLYIVLIWLGVGLGSTAILVGRYIRSGSIGARHVRWRSIEFTGAILACTGWSLYLILAVTQMIFVDELVPATHPLGDWGIVGPSRLALSCLAAIMVCLTLERVLEIYHIVGIERNNYKGKVSL